MWYFIFVCEGGFSLRLSSDSICGWLFVGEVGIVTPPLDGEAGAWSFDFACEPASVLATFEGEEVTSEIAMAPTSALPQSWLAACWSSFVPDMRETKSDLKPHVNINTI